jgi:hypothetical protein
VQNDYTSNQQIITLAMTTTALLWLGEPKKTDRSLNWWIALSTNKTFMKSTIKAFKM